jgi:hypothetical protein
MQTERLPVEGSAEEQREREVARRRLLKTLVAAGGVFTASSVLPAKWLRPLVEMGMLPSHAQASGTPRPLCYTATPSHTPSVSPTCYTPTIMSPTLPLPSDTPTLSSTATPALAPPQARQQLLDRLLSEGRFPEEIARKLD